MPDKIASTTEACPRLTPTCEAAPRIVAPPAAGCAVCVVIPARDEASVIERTLGALAAQRDLNGAPLAPETYEVILLANNCQDDTVAVTRQWARRHASFPLHVVDMRLPPALAHVGAARRMAMDEACRRLLSLDRPHGVIATTDADTLVSPTWIAATLREVALGSEAIGGRILVTAQERAAMRPSVRRRFLRNVGYCALANEVTARIDPLPGDPWPRHEQFFGASLAVTTRAYRAVGGLPVLSSGEDVALAAALRHADIEIRHSPAVRVQTSGRLDGRAPAGLAALLASWSHLSPDDPYHLVPSAATVVARAVCQRALRDLWHYRRTHREVCASEIVRLSEFADLPAGWLGHAVLAANRFGVLLAEVEGRARWQRAPELVDVRVAIEGLRAWLEPYRRPGTSPPTFARHVAGLPFLPPMLARGRHTTQTRRGLSLAPLEQVQPVGAFATPLAPPPQVA